MLLKWGLQLLFVVFFGGLALSIVWKAYLDGRIVDAVLGASLVVLLVGAVFLRVKERVLG